MKLNKKKLIALGLSALMCVSPLSSVAFAEELSDGSEEVVAVEELESGETEAAQLDQVADTTDAYAIDVSTIKFHYDEEDEEDGYPDYTVTYYKYNTRTGQRESSITVNKELASVFAQTEPDCENPAYMILQIKLDEKTYYSADETKAPNYDNGFIVKGTKPLGHHYVQVGKGYNYYDEYCHAVIYDLYVCDRDGCTNEKHGWAYTYDLKSPKNRFDIPEFHERRVITWIDEETELHQWDTATTTIITSEEYNKEGSKLKEKYPATGVYADLSKLTNTTVDESGNAILYDVTKPGVYAIITERVCKRNPEHKDTNVTLKTIDVDAQKIVLAKVDKVDNKTIANPEVLIGRILYSADPAQPANMPASEEICLVDCFTSGSYEVGYYDKDGNKVAKKTFTVEAPHHYLPYVTVEFESVDDANLCKVVYNTKTYTVNGKQVTKNISVKSIVNTSCWKTVKYYVVQHCSYNKCKCTACYSNKAAVYYDEDGWKINKYLDGHAHEISRTSDTVAPTGEHVINTKVKKIIDAMVEPLTAADYDTIIALAKDSKSFIKITDNSSCTKEGTITIEYLCMVCKEIQSKYTKTLKVKALGHKWPLTPIMEYVKEPTCENEGLFNRVWECERCHLIKKDENVRAPRLPHTNELSVTTDSKGNDVGINDYNNTKKNAVEVIFRGDIVVDYNATMKEGDVVRPSNDPLSTTMPRGVEGTKQIAVGSETVNCPGFGSIAGANQATKDYIVYAYLGTRCSVCGKHEVPLSSNAPEKMVSLTITKLVPNGSDGKAGSITLAPTYTDKDGKIIVAPGSTFDYFSDVNAFQARVIDTTTPASEKINPELVAKDINVIIGKTATASVVYDGYGALSYESEDPTIATVDANGVVTGIKAGSTTITVKLEGTTRYNSATTSFKVDVRPAGTVIYRLFDEGEGTMRVYWRTVEGVEGIQFAWATDADFSDAQYSTETRAVNNQRRFNLDATTYYVKVRTFVYNESGKKVYSTWSNAKTIDLGIHLAAPKTVTCEVRPSGSVEFKVAKASNEDGYQLAYSNDGGQNWKTSSAFDTTFIRKLGTGSFQVKVRAFVETGYGRYYSAWYEAGTVTIQ